MWHFTSSKVRTYRRMGNYFLTKTSWMHTHVDTHCGLWNMNHIIFHHSSHNWNRCILKTTMPNLKTSRNFWKITLFKSILIKWLSEVVLSCIIQYFFLWKLNNLTRIRGLHSEQFLKLSPNSEISELLLVLKLAFLLYFTVLVDNLWISIKKRSKILWGGGRGRSRGQDKSCR